MAGPDRSAAKSARDLVERFALAGVGAVALTADRIDELAGELAEGGGIRRDEARQLIEDAVTRWRGDTTRLVERAGESMQSVFGGLGLVTRDEFDELELRVAQLEHRLRLVEGKIETPTSPATS
jgi:polyhydroxyalkanoate synthesis regulator phasin